MQPSCSASSNYTRSGDAQSAYSVHTARRNWIDGHGAARDCSLRARQTLTGADVARGRSTRMCLQEEYLLLPNVHGRTAMTRFRVGTNEVMVEQARCWCGGNNDDDSAAQQRNALCVERLMMMMRSMCDRNVHHERQLARQCHRHHRRHQPSNESSGCDDTERLRCLIGCAAVRH